MELWPNELLNIFGLASHTLLLWTPLTKEQWIKLAQIPFLGVLGLLYQ